METSIKDNGKMGNNMEQDIILNFKVKLKKVNGIWVKDKDGLIEIVLHYFFKVYFIKVKYFLNKIIYFIVNMSCFT